MLKPKNLARRKPGRPRRTDLNPAIIAALRRRDFSWRAIAKSLGAGVGTVRRIHAAWLDQLAQMKKIATMARRTSHGVPKTNRDHFVQVWGPKKLEKKYEIQEDSGE